MTGNNEKLPIDERKIISLIGFAAKARKLVVCTEQVLSEVRRHGDPEKKANGIVLIATGISANTEKRIINSCSYYNVEYYKLQTSSDELARMTGKGAEAAAVATFDAGFTKAIRKIIKI